MTRFAHTRRSRKDWWSVMATGGEVTQFDVVERTL